MAVLPAAFAVASRLRQARAFHPRGVTVLATWRPAERSGPLEGSPLVDRDRAALLRLSHGVGLPPRLPDILGWAIKVLDVHGPGRDQDLLLASTGRGRLGRHLLRAGRDLATTTLSTLLPYAVAGAGRSVIVARGRDGAPAATYADLVREGPSVLPVYEVRFARTDGPLLATVHPGDRAPAGVGEAARFDPWHTGPELRPVGWLNRLRAPTYIASQDARGAPVDGWRAAASGPTPADGRPRLSP